MKNKIIIGLIIGLVFLSGCLEGGENAQISGGIVEKSSGFRRDFQSLETERETFNITYEYFSPQTIGAGFYEGSLEVQKLYIVEEDITCYFFHNAMSDWAGMSCFEGRK